MGIKLNCNRYDTELRKGRERGKLNYVFMPLINAFRDLWL